MKIKLLTDTARVPTRGSAGAAGYDLYADGAYDIAPGGMVKVSTGIATEIPEGMFGAIYPRSGIATKQGLRLANCVAVIDSDYRGEWLVPLYNDSDEMQSVEPGTRIAQVIFQSYNKTEFDVVDELSSSARGAGGFGSTGTLWLHLN